MTELDQYKNLLIQVKPVLDDVQVVIDDILIELGHVIDMSNQRIIMLERDCELLRETVAIQNQKDNPLHRRIGELTKEIRQLKSKKK